MILFLMESKSHNHRQVPITFLLNLLKICKRFLVQIVQKFLRLVSLVNKYNNVVNRQLTVVEKSQDSDDSKIKTYFERLRLAANHIIIKLSKNPNIKKTLLIEVNGFKRTQKVQLALGPESTQREVFEVVHPLISKVSEGFNISVLSYGQTGSGKTHTMFGNDWNNIVKLNTGSSGLQSKRKQQMTFLRSIQQDQNYAGIIPRSIYLLFQNLITKRRKHIKVYCSFLQLYNENMTDLLEDDPKLAKQQKLIIHQNKQDGIYVEGLNQIVVQDPQQCLQLMQRGERNRIVRQTHMNTKSSRSHTIFTLLIEEVFPSKKSYRRMKINLCDLAGSQKIHKGQTMTGAHFQQLKNINLSLTTLGKVINSLSNPKAVPPYRQSKLTRLLQDTLGGNTRTAIIAAIAPKASCLEQSLNTLKFLQRAQQIKGQIVAKMYSDNPQMRNLQREVNYLRDMLKMRGGNLTTDLQLRQKFKALQHENQKLRQAVDQDLVQRLKRQNTNLRNQLTYERNDVLSDSRMRLEKKKTLDSYPTLQHETINSEKEEVIANIASQSNTAKFARNYKKQDTKSLAGKTEDSFSQNRSTFKRGTGQSLFPSVNKAYSRGPNKILQRIMQIQKTKQQNKLRLQKQLEQLQKRAYNEDKKISKHHRV